MGNSTSSDGSVKSMIKDHVYPKHQQNTGISGLVLQVPPKSLDPTFRCQSCSSVLYDAGLCQSVTCKCLNSYRRLETSEISPVASSTFNKFEWHDPIRKRTNQELISITLGIFEEDPEIDFNAILAQSLKPYFLARTRYLKKGDLFVTDNGKFKVMSSEPREGFVGKNTRIHFYSALSVSQLVLLRLVPKYQYDEDQFLLVRNALKHFREHIHQDETLRIANMEFLVSRSHPSNGLVGPDTIVHYEQEPVSKIKELLICPYIDRELSNPIEDFREMIHSYIVPYFKGWNRVVQSGQKIQALNFSFKVYANPPYGIVDSQTCVEINVSHVKRIKSPVMRLSQIHTFTINPSYLPHLQDECVICTFSFEEGNSVKSLPCHHVFHAKCLDKWFKFKQTCPLCKIKLEL